VRPPRSGKRDAARKLAGGLRRKLGMPETGPPPPQEAPEPPMTPDQAAHRIDAARARLRSTIAPPDDDQR
jgi:hypothetical protein